jgi:hypothetical protein
MGTALLKTLFVFAALVAAFNLGRYSAEFSGSPWAWTAVAGSIVTLAVTLGFLLHDFWSV